MNVVAAIGVEMTDGSILYQSVGGIEEETMLMWEGVREVPNLKTEANQIVEIRVFIGGIDGVQVGPFMAAYGDVVAVLHKLISPRRLRIEYMSVKSVSEQGWSIEDLINWLLGSHIHFILSHIHQGFKSHGNQLDMNNVMAQLKRLTYHPGFPSGQQLSCPVFTQDKINYIKPLLDMANDTLRVDLVEGGHFAKVVLQELKRYLLIL